MVVADQHGIHLARGLGNRHRTRIATQQIVEAPSGNELAMQTHERRALGVVEAEIEAQHLAGAAVGVLFQEACQQHLLETA